MKTDANWLEFIAQDYCESVRDGTHDSPKFHDSGYPLVTSKAIKDGALVLDNAGFISESDFNEINKRSRVEQWDVLFTMIGTLGDVYLERSPEVNYAIKNIGLFKCGDELKAKWLYYWFRIPSTKAAILQIRRGASQQYLPLGTLRTLRIRYPANNKIAERIVEVASQYDDLIENNKRRIALLEESARQLYKEWFVRFRFPGHEHVKIVDGVPEGWKMGTISDFYKTSSGGTPSRKIQEFYTGQINWVKTQELNNGFIFETTERITEDAISKSSAKLYPSKTVLVAMYGATIGQLGILANPGTCNQACCALIPEWKEANYIYAFLFLKENKNGLISLGKGSAQNNISQEIIKLFPMKMPPSTLMMQFTDYLSPTFRQIEVLSLEITQLSKARDLLLPKLMNGEIAV